MRASKEALNLIKEFEGFSPVAYICPAGYKTIGYGHVISSNDNFSSINENDAEELLSKDIGKAEDAVNRNIIVNLKQEQFDALVSFAFNVGAAALQRSTLRQKINRQEHEYVPKELMRWVYAGGNIMPGLVRRRMAELELYVS